MVAGPPAKASQASAKPAAACRGPVTPGKCLRALKASAASAARPCGVPLVISMLCGGVRLAQQSISLPTTPAAKEGGSLRIRVPSATEPGMVSMTLFSTSAVASHGPAASRKAPASVYRSTCNSEPPGSLQTGPLQGNFDPVAELPVLAERSVMPLEVDRRNSPMPESDVIVEVERYIADPGRRSATRSGKWKSLD